MNTNVFRGMSYGVYVVSTFDTAHSRATGCVANSVMQITSSPATVAISINHNNYTNDCIAESGRFAVSILTEDTDPAVFGAFGFKSGRDSDKFEGIVSEVRDGLSVLSSAHGYFTCKVINKMETETHTVFLGEVIDGDLLTGAAPMTYAYYHLVKGGKSPKNAPTFLQEAEAPRAPSKKYRCTVCGYVYDGETPFDQLPANYECPICGVGKDKFEEI